MGGHVTFLALFVAGVLTANAAPPSYPAVEQGRGLVFPRDHGAHPEFRTEWWYVTGWVTSRDGKARGFQVTFFRSRPPLDQSNPSRFAARQLLFAHAAVSDPAAGRLRHDQRAAREGFGLAQASVTDTDVRIDDWRLQREQGGTYLASVSAGDFRLELRLEPTQPLLLQGEKGFSRKGPSPGQASHYYSQPHLRVAGTLVRESTRESVTGEAWLDHEWSTEYLAEEAVGWDWVGLNLDGGAALMLFQIRDKNGGKFWAAGTWRGSDGQVRSFSVERVMFQPVKRWRSPRTATEYPVGMRVRAGEFELELKPLMDDQELDSRGSTGAVYWEGAVTAVRDGSTVGRGYLELTGYHKPLSF